MASWLVQWTPEKIQAEADRKGGDPAHAFAEYVQQTMGVPWPTIKDLSILRKHCKEFFKMYPTSDWHTMCRIANYHRTRKRRFERVYMIVVEFRKAWADGALPELDPGYAGRNDDQLEAEITRALETETRPEWRHRLIMAAGVEARREAYEAWVQSSLSQ